MDRLHNKGFLRVLALLALLLFTGDLIGDVVVDMTQGHCASETSQSVPTHDKAPCSHCLCATHAGAVVLADFAVRLLNDLQPSALLDGADEATPPSLAASIDHPPQLA
jgi:hypothetical protein